VILLFRPAGLFGRRRREVALAGALRALLALPAVLSSYALTIFILIFFYGFLGQAGTSSGATRASSRRARRVRRGRRLHVGGAVDRARAHAVDRHVRGRRAGRGARRVIGYLGFRFGCAASTSCC
jgi:hypothetical protein